MGQLLDETWPKFAPIGNSKLCDPFLIFGRSNATVHLAGQLAGPNLEALVEFELASDWF